MLTVRTLIERLQALPPEQHDLPVAVYDVDSGCVHTNLKSPYLIAEGEDGQGEAHPDCIGLQVNS